MARAIADSPLVKTAMHGGDPNWGRIISSAGAAHGRAGRLPERVARAVRGHGGRGRGGLPCLEDDRARMAAGMKLPEIDIELDLGLGTASAELFFADMGHEYITINAEYHS